MGAVFRRMVGEDEGSPFLVMERLRGASLRERLGRVGRLDPAEAIRVTLRSGGASSRA